MLPPRQAERLAERALDREPDNPGAMVQLGNVRMIMGRRESAVDLARRARAIAPQAPGALQLQAECDRDVDAASLLADIEGALDGGQIYLRRHALLQQSRICCCCGVHVSRNSSKLVWQQRCQGMRQRRCPCGTPIQRPAVRSEQIGQDGTILLDLNSPQH